jgi:predicted DNA-binding transcriptional regulator AlpA
MEREATTNQPQRKRCTKPQPLEALNAPDALLTAATTSAVTGLSVSSLYRLAKSGELVPVKRGARCTRWPAACVRAWLAEQSAPAVTS